MTDDGVEDDVSESTPQDDPLKNGLDKGSGDPDEDRAFLMDQPPAQVTSPDDSPDEDDDGDGDSDDERDEDSAL